MCERSRGEAANGAIQEEIILIELHDMIARRCLGEEVSPWFASVDSLTAVRNTVGGERLGTFGLAHGLDAFSMGGTQVPSGSRYATLSSFSVERFSIDPMPMTLRKNLDVLRKHLMVRRPGVAPIYFSCREDQGASPK
jgi:hypothetical protein